MMTFRPSKSWHEVWELLAFAFSEYPGCGVVVSDYEEYFAARNIRPKTVHSAARNLGVETFSLPDGRFGWRRPANVVPSTPDGPPPAITLAATPRGAA